MSSKRPMQRSISYLHTPEELPEGQKRNHRETLPTLDQSFFAGSSLEDAPTEKSVETINGFGTPQPAIPREEESTDPEPGSFQEYGIHPDQKRSLIGQTIGNLEIIEEIGKGGFCTVYRAEQLYVKTSFAIKVLNVADPTEADIERFKREAVILSKLKHPHIVQFFDFGFLYGQGFYLVMEYLKGQTLVQRLNALGLPTMDELLFIYEHLCDILLYIHQQGIWHRDLKPSNILIQEEPGGKRQVKLIDFGIALSADEETHLTKTGTCVGTAQYLSPEQIRKKALDGRSDLYSITLLLHLMLVAKLPFNLQDISTLRGMQNKLRQRPSPLSKWVPEQPWAQELEDFMQKALTADRKARYPHAMAFWRALEQALQKQKECLAAFRSGQEASQTSTFAPQRELPTPKESPEEVAPQPNQPQESPGREQKTPSRKKWLPWLVLVIAGLLLLVLHKMYPVKNTPQNVSPQKERQGWHEIQKPKK